MKLHLTQTNGFTSICGKNSMSANIVRTISLNEFDRMIDEKNDNRLCKACVKKRLWLVK